MCISKRKRNEETRRFDTFVEAATVYHSICKANVSFTSFPKFFTIPNQTPWPTHLRGIKLNTAQVRTHYKNGTLHPDTIASLQAINFVFDVNELKWELKLIALKTYKQLYGDLCIPQDFRIPSNDDKWPKDLWGMRLGLAVRSIRQKTEATSPRYAQLSELGFVWNVLELSWETKILALATYKSLFGNLLVAYSFKVPKKATWPKETWDLKLGHAVHNIRQNVLDMLPERKQQLDALGFVWDYLELSWEAKLTALRTYKELYGNLNVPYGFIVPSHDDKGVWPKETWGMKLGHAVHNIRQNTKELSTSRKDQLNSIDFVWSSSVLSIDIKLLALQVYYRLYGHLNVPTGFRVPKDDMKWPKKTWQLQLADIIDEIYRNKTQLTPKQKQTLESIEFSWQTDEVKEEYTISMETISICDGFPLLKRLRHIHVAS
ncbi:hypothetical protein THRCLA_03401 [Thraustotheca clavata]|uniref:Helicase-associated domain-containing protein n=1 Tax=Thraustotheca clavata TaxID=74557 RepID=A0A1W0A2T6_9STRA|nr:hypothetical protein THRCLA_03401 [Thraustotheca clavata]